MTDQKKEVEFSTAELAEICRIRAEVEAEYAVVDVSARARGLEARGWRAWYAEMFGEEFVNALAPHHAEAIEWHWNSRLALIRGGTPDYFAYFSIWARGNMKTTIARRMVIADACLSVSARIGGYSLIVGGTKRKCAARLFRLNHCFIIKRSKNITRRSQK